MTLNPTTRFGDEMREQRRVITALFADTVGSTALGERLDPEDFHDIVGGCVARMIVAVERFGGAVKDLVGDGILAVFGAVGGYEDDAQRAVFAGLDIVREIAAYATQVVNDFGVEGIGVRVGIQSGRAIVGSIGAGAKVEYGAMGDPLNTAARLQGAAAPGTVVVGASTQRIVAALFDWSEPRTLSLKGKAEPVVAYEVRGVRIGTASVRGLRGLRAPLIGRDAERRSLETAARQLLSGQGGMLFVTGEAGIGKSRILAELGAILVRLGPDPEPALWLEAGCASFRQTVPYQAFQDLLQRWLRLGPRPPPDQVRAALHRQLQAMPADRRSAVEPFLAGILAISPEEDDPEPQSGTPEARQQRTFEAVRILVEALAADAPTVVAIEDLHWADPTSLQLAHHLLVLAERAGVLLAFTARPEPGHALWQLRDDAVRRLGERAWELPLNVLREDGDQALLEALVGRGTLPAAVGERVLASAEGNPFYLEELVRSLIDAGVLVPEGHGWHFSHDTPVEVPATIEKVIMARVDRVSHQAYQALCAASVLGREFAVPLLEEVLGRDTDLRPAMEELERLDLITGQGVSDSEYRFRHAVIQETVYGSLLRRRRRELHSRAARALERLYPERRGDLAATLALHFRQAGQPQQAVRYFTLAGDRARSAYANAEAIASYRAALELLDEADRVPGGDSADRTESTVEILEHLGGVEDLLGHHEQARQAFERALSLTARDRRLHRSRLYRKIGGTWQIRRQFASALESYRMAEDALGQAPDDQDHGWWREWLDVQTVRTEVHYWLNEVDEMAALVRQVRPVLERHGTPAQRSDFFGNLLFMASRRDRYVISDETLGYGRARLAAAEEMGEPFQVATAQFNLGFSLLFYGNLDEAERRFLQSLGFAERAGDVTLQARSLTYLSILYRKRGLIDEVRSYIERSLGAAEAGGMVEYITLAKANQSWLAWRAGNLAEAEREGRTALEELRALPIPYPLHWLALWPLLAAALARDDTETAVAHAQALLPAPQQPPPEQLASLLTSGIDAWDRGRRDAATRNLRAAVEVAQDLAYL
jgi:class 3 adenylate cyclase/tetratricopeptide (TPR) repeat protein